MTVFLKILILLLGLFAPFSFGGTEPWAFSFLQSGIFAVFLTVLIKRHHFYVTPLLKPVIFILSFLASAALIQSLFPTSILKPPTWHPSTLSRLYSLEHASTFLTWIAAVLAASQIFQTRKEVLQGLGIIAGCGIAIALSVFFFPGGEYVSFFLGYKHRAMGPFFNRNHAGAFLAMSALAIAGLGLAPIPLYKHHPEPLEKKLSKQLIIWFMFCIAAAADIYTKSRGGTLSLLVGILTLMLLLGIYIPHETRRKAFFAFVVLGISAISACLIADNIQAINEYANRGHESIENNTRIKLYKSVPVLLENRRAWGLGIGSLPLAIEPLTRKSYGRYVERLHSDWLEIYLGVGNTGAFIILCGLLWYIYEALKTLGRLRKKKKVIFAAITAGQIVMLTACAFDYEFFVPADAFTFFLLTGLACTPSFSKHHVKTFHTSIYAKYLAAAICMMAVIIPIKKTMAWRYVFLGQSRFKTEKLAYFEKAMNVYPGSRYGLRSSVAYYNTAIGEEKTGDIENAEKHRDRAMEITLKFLKMYPKDRELSEMYFRIKGIQKKKAKKKTKIVPALRKSRKSPYGN